MRIIHQVNNEEDFEYYYSHISYECKHFLKNNHPNHYWKFANFYNDTIGSNEQYHICYKAFDYDLLREIKIIITVTRKDDIFVVTSSNPSCTNS